MFASVFFNRAGFRTVRASKRPLGLGAFIDEIDIPLTDWSNLPHMAGGGLAAQLRERKPASHVFFH